MALTKTNQIHDDLQRLLMRATEMRSELEELETKILCYMKEHPENTIISSDDLNESTM